MLKLLRWPAAFALLAFLIAWPIAAWLTFMVWLMGRALYGRRPDVVILNLAIVALGGMLFIAAVLGIPLLLAAMAAVCMVVIGYKPYHQPQPKTKPQVDDSDVIDVEVISVQTIERKPYGTH